MAVFSGPYGQYVKHGKLNCSLPEGKTAEDVTMEEAVGLLAAKAEAKGAGKAARTATTGKTTGKRVAKTKKTATKKATAGAKTAATTSKTSRATRTRRAANPSAP